jgi:hypothetical protein
MKNSHFGFFGRLSVIATLPVFCVTLTGCWFQPAFVGSVSNASSSSTGTLGKYQFASQEDVNRFNSEVADWLTKRGYVVDCQRSFATIAGSDSWKTDGLLLCREIDAKNQFFVFIPKCKRPEENIQIIGFHSDLKGTPEEVKQRQNDFEAENEAFRQSFPDTWEPRSQ